MDEKNRKRYFLANEDLYQLTVDFECLLFAFEKLNLLISTKLKPDIEECILISDFSAYQFIDYEELENSNKDTLTRIAILLCKQILKFKYGESMSIPIIEDYEKAYDRWKLNNISKKETKECKLDDVILDKEIKEDVLSTINFVKNMEKYKEIGCELPSGILLEGSPGTGKTLLAKSIASESNMNFKSIVASDFAEKYVGESSKKVQKIFDDLKNKGGGILFIDEIDAIGVNREGDDNKEYRSAMNKLLSCMNEASDNKIIVIGATNLVEQLDPALIREGRFDKVITIPLPSYELRVELFKLYVGKLKHEKDINYELLAKITEGKTGAFIHTVCNHSGIYAVDKGLCKVNQGCLLHTIERMVRDKKVKKSTIGFK